MLRENLWRKRQWSGFKFKILKSREQSKWLIMVPITARVLVKLTATIIILVMPSMQAGVIHSAKEVVSDTATLYIALELSNRYSDATNIWTRLMYEEPIPSH